jgi:probable addiction module antidote protein
MMKKKIRIADLPEFDAAAYLDSEEAIAEYFTAMTEDGNPTMLAGAQSDIARARRLIENSSASR